MHGRPRKPTKPEDEEARAAKSAKLRSLQSQFLHNHHNKIYTKEALELSAKLLEINPEFYTAWNYRKLALQHHLSLSHSDSNLEDDVINSLLNEELRVVNPLLSFSVTESALRQNFKSYGAWHHRKWVLAKGHSSVDHEMRLLHKFQKADPRNFHAWNYRRFVAELMKRSEEEELKFTTDMINTNISNYSAWHNRSDWRKETKLAGKQKVVEAIEVSRPTNPYAKPTLGKCFKCNQSGDRSSDCPLRKSALLSFLLRRGVRGFSPKEKVLTEEFELVHQAIFTDEDDQSGWFYHLWLLDQTINLDVPLLISSWPAHGSDLTATVDGYLEDCSCFSSMGFYSKTRKFPLVLYFNHPVEGVSPSTVEVNYAFSAKNEFIWTPLSRNNSGTARAWVTHLNFPDVKVDSSNTYSVEVSLGNTQGIISLSGFHYSHPLRFAFTVRILPHSSESAGEQSSMVAWKEEYFHPIHESSLIISVNQTSNNVDNELSKWHIDTINDEITLFRDLLSVTNCKIGKLTLARLLVAHDALMQQNKAFYKMLHSEEVLELYNDLMKMDPSHCEYYKRERGFALMREVTANKESLLKHCFCYKGLMPLSLASSICLRLNAFSLSQIGCIEQLLWVQMLDLSHNELHSIEGVMVVVGKMVDVEILRGLEAMQLLSCLNLSHNKISSFTALEPLTLLKSLTVLDISFNEIGAHSIDTTRYLCPSPLSHTGEWNVTDFEAAHIEVKKYWEAFVFFKGMPLMQLDIMGNVINDENFKSFLVKLIPTIRWLDGEELH
ncbi:Protein prenyltransferase, alpha subunit [Dillenia turbinata]|uniref:Geranylgeranyl transferase type-2 subunit alpha n=1 Tax=Dillenia turbinata TaxID=194707 RepID=A0AAN8ZPM9_9MAGN